MNAKALGVAVILAGCAAGGDYPRASYAERLEPWKGASAGELLRVWGPPDRKQEFADGRRAFVYVKQQTISIPQMGTVTARGEIMGSPASGQDIRLFCETTFYISPKGVVERTQALGNHCVGRQAVAPRP